MSEIKTEAEAIRDAKHEAACAILGTPNVKSMTTTGEYIQYNLNIDALDITVKQAEEMAEQGIPIVHSTGKVIMCRNDPDITPK